MSKPVRLAKQDNSYSCNYFSHISERVSAWCLRHAPFLFCLLIIVSLILFVVLIWALVGVSATESGLQYNQIKNII